jgi:hypothetical protein
VLRIDRSHSLAGLTFMALVTAIIWWRIGPVGDLDPGIAAMVGVPGAITLAALLFRRDNADDGVVRSVLAGCAAAATVLNAWFASGTTADTFTLVVDVMLLVMFMTIWSGYLDGREVPQPASARSAKLRTGRWARIQVVAIIAGAAVASVAYRLLVLQKLEQSSALFIGIPAVLAITVSLTARPRSAIETALKATLVTLLISLVFMGEGLVCVLMAAPLFLGVAVIIGALVERTRKRRSSVKAAMVLAFLPFTMEGVHPEFSFPRDEMIQVTRAVNATSDQVRRNLSQTPEFSSPLPAFFHLGFPLPTETRGEGLSVGDIRRIRFAGGEGQPGWLSLEVTGAESQRVQFRVLSDTSHIAHWMTWQESEVRWREVEPGKTEVQWQLRYRRELDPAWYFGPWERYAVGLAAEYLVENVAGANR